MTRKPYTISCCVLWFARTTSTNKTIHFWWYQVINSHHNLSSDVQIDASKEIRACNYLPQVCVEGSEEDVATVETRALCGADGVSGIVPIRLLNNSRGQQWWRCLNGAKCRPKRWGVSSNCESRRIVQKTNKTRKDGSWNSIAAPPPFSWGGREGERRVGFRGISPLLMVLLFEVRSFLRLHAWTRECHAVYQDRSRFVRNLKSFPGDGGKNMGGQVFWDWGYM